MELRPGENSQSKNENPGRVKAVSDYVAGHWDFKEPSWSDLTLEDHAVLQYVDRLPDETPYPDRPSDPADESLIEHLLAVTDSEFQLTRILLDADQLKTISAGQPSCDEWNARLDARRLRATGRQ